MAGDGGKKGGRPGMSDTMPVTDPGAAAGSDFADIASAPTIDPIAAEGIGDTVSADAKPHPTPQVRGPVAPGLKKGELIDHFVVLSRVGAGGMGVVYLAYDPSLDRKVAIKLVKIDGDQPGAGEVRGARLLREAQAMAQISHPNVIPVYEVGVIGGEAFVAMEYIDGDSLAVWLKRAPRRAREVLAAFIEAGAGLAAAHRVGLVHRDFKPDNALRGKDGRVRVLDFGLARALDAPPDAPPSDVPDKLRSSSGGGLRSSLTMVGAIMGTPAYMSPEQHLGKQTDPATDQFSFCVALYEALYGERPFAGDDYPTLMENVIAGRVRAAPEGSHVPAWLRAVLLRGVASKPEERWPSMDALLVELARDPAGRRRRVLIGAAAVIAIAGAGAAVAMTQRAPVVAATPCSDSAAQLARVWDPFARRAVERGFRAASSPIAQEQWPRVAAQLDSYAWAWVGARTEACEATRVHRTQSEDVLDLRMFCLEDARLGFAALADVLAHADDGVVEKGVQLAGGLQRLERCADVENLARAVKLPDDPAARERLATARRALQLAETQTRAGHYDAALAALAGIAAEGANLGYPPLSGEVMLRRGYIQSKSGKPEAAEKSLEKAFELAEAAGDDRTRAAAVIELVVIVGADLSRPADGHAWARRGEAVIARLGKDPGLLADLRITEGIVYVSEGAYDTAVPLFDEALAIRRKVLGERHVDVGLALGNRGLILLYIGKEQEALGFFAQALPILEEGFGKNHPQVGELLVNIGSAYIGLERYADARAPLERALGVFQASLWPEHPKIVGALTNLGIVADETGELDDALGYYRRALALVEQRDGADGVEAARPLVNLALLERKRGRYEEARRLIQRAGEIRAKAMGASHAEMAIVYFTAAEIDLDDGRLDDAIAAYLLALGIYRASSGDDSWEVADTRRALGEAYRRKRDFVAAKRELDAALASLTAEDPDEPEAYAVHAALGLLALDQRQAGKAVVHLERAVALAERGGLSALARAPLAFALARALWEAGKERPRALGLAVGARDALAAGGPAHARQRREVDAWLSARR